MVFAPIDELPKTSLPLLPSMMGPTAYTTAIFGCLPEATVGFRAPEQIEELHHAGDAGEVGVDMFLLVITHHVHVFCVLASS